MHNLAALLTELTPIAAHYDELATARLGLKTGHSLEAIRSSERALDDDFHTTTFGRISFRRVDGDAQEQDTIVADARLQRRLESLCEKLRSR